MLLVQLGINNTRDVWKFCQNWTSRRGQSLLIPNCTRQRMITFTEGPEGVKWELGFANFLAGKMGFHALGLDSSTNKQ